VHPRPFERNGLTMVPLTRRPGGLQAFKQLYPPQWPGRELEQRSHEGYEWMYVLSGRLRLLLGEHDFWLKPGEVAEFDTHVPHAFATGPEATEVLCLFGPQGERLHVRAGPAGR
jgi:quercetin dioxygenase-like cupin family protein